jgi:Fe2+ transport system protein FeoA
MVMRLSEIGAGTAGRVTGVSGEARLKRRLFDMGLTPGVPLHVVRMAPMGDPMEIHLRGYALTLRKAEAEGVSVEVDS